MFDLSTLFLSAAHAAEEAAPVAQASAGEEIMRFVPLFLIFMVFYFILIRPQQKKFESQVKMQKGLKKGDKVLIGSGLLGTVVREEGDALLLVEIAKGVEVKALRSSVTGRVDDEKKITPDKT